MAIGLVDLLPEIYPIIASHLPLYITPSTLLALALVNRDISAIVLPLLYSRLILKTDKDALAIFQRLLDEPELGKRVRELHSLFDLYLATIQRLTIPFNVLTGLHQVITKGLLPHIHTLHLYQEVKVFPLEKEPTDVTEASDFWSSLHTNCPRLRGLILKNFSKHAELSNRMDTCDLLELQGITCLKLNFTLLTISKKEVDKVLKCVEYLSPGLHTLDLEPGFVEGWTSADSLFALNFPRLRSLSLDGFTLSDPGQATEFWKRHPNLESLRIVSQGDTRWISKDLVFENFLPNLRHLKARFNDVRLLAPILDQLISLTIYDTINAQVPYLLRLVLPDGLPNLKSLTISQILVSDDEHEEGARWYETESGVFCLASGLEEASREVTNGYIHSIVLGAPNLEEFCLYGESTMLQRYAEIASEIGRFRNLRRFYFLGSSIGLTDEDRTAMITSTKALAEACGQLTMVVDTASGWGEPPYVVARISRGRNGEVASVDLGRIYYGMQIGNEDEAFPQNW